MTGATFNGDVWGYAPFTDMEVYYKYSNSSTLAASPWVTPHKPLTAPIVGGLNFPGFDIKDICTPFTYQVLLSFTLETKHPAWWAYIRAVVALERTTSQLDLISVLSPPGMF